MLVNRQEKHPLPRYLEPTVMWEVLRPPGWGKAADEWQAATPGTSGAWNTFDRCGIPELRAEWTRLAAESPGLRGVFQSPVYFDHVCATGAYGVPALAVARTEEGGVRAVVPLTLSRTSYPILLRGNRFLYVPVEAVCVVGGSPALPSDPQLVRGFLRAVSSAFPTRAGIALERIPNNDPLLNQLHEPGTVPDNFFLSGSPAGCVAHHTLPLPASFEDYLGQLTKKKRYNLNRQVRIFGDHCGGTDLTRLESPQDFGPFFEEVTPAGGTDSQGSILFDPAYLVRLRDLAGRGLLRGYLLRHGRILVASMLGYRYDPTYLLESIRYHAAYARFSPGAVLLHLVVKDLITTRAATRINFSDGNPAYSYRDTQALALYTPVLLLRRTVRNYGLQALDRGWQWLKHSWKSLTGGGSGAGPQTAFATPELPYDS
jgi:CelD/BcsL family acetyltransferase involved in cellulose biosynthesis